MELQLLLEYDVSAKEGIVCYCYNAERPSHY